MKYYSQLYKVENKDRYKTANPYYWLVKTPYRSYLFTDSDIEKAADRANNNLEDLPKDKFYKPKGFITPFIFGFFFSTLLTGFFWLIFS